MQCISLRRCLVCVLHSDERFFRFVAFGIEYDGLSHPPKELQMPQNAKDSKGGKTHPVKDTADNGGKKSDKGSADQKSGSPTGSHNKGEKKTTP